MSFKLCHRAADAFATGNHALWGCSGDAHEDGKMPTKHAVVLLFGQFSVASPLSGVK
jgi:hypothetical protein